MPDHCHPDLRQVMLTALPPVDHEAGQPLFSLVHFLLTKGLEAVHEKKKKSIEKTSFKMQAISVKP